jgi:hypothetical protein
VTDSNLVAFVPRLERDTPGGENWDEFMQRQHQVLEESGREGRRLVTAIQVTYQQGKFGGVLLYFSGKG